MAKNDQKATQAQEQEKEKKEPGPFAILSPYTPPEGIDLSPVEGDDVGQAPTLFVLVGEYVGKTSKQAIGQAVAQHGGGEYIAVPKRSFTARKVESVGVPRLKWS